MSTTATTNVFLTGATGYIGGGILNEILLKDKQFKITALVRSEEKANLLQELGVNAIVGTLDDSEIITKAASQADLVIETANCDHLGNAKAIVAGLEKSFKETGKEALYVHTSGSALVIDPATHPLGELDPNVFDDTDEEQIASLPATNPHRHVDTYITERSSSYNLVIVAPTMVFGPGIGIPSISNNRSIILPVLIKGVLEQKIVPQYKNGENTWGIVHIEELVQAYKKLIYGLLAGSVKNLGANGLYFVSNDEVPFKDMTNKVAEIAYKKGIIPAQEVQRLAKDELEKVFGAMMAFFLGTSSRVKAKKVKRLGWDPKFGAKDFIDGIQEEFEYFQSKE
jgi:nucleoside-diphosphate-sugar epimerase